MLARNGRNPIAEENSVRVVGGGAVDADLTQLASYKDLTVTNYTGVNGALGSTHFSLQTARPPTGW
jgi:hypothetical protein